MFSFKWCYTNDKESYKNTFRLTDLIFQLSEGLTEFSIMIKTDGCRLFLLTEQHNLFHEYKKSNMEMCIYFKMDLIEIIPLIIWKLNTTFHFRLRVNKLTNFTTRFGFRNFSCTWTFVQKCLINKLYPFIEIIIQLYVWAALYIYYRYMHFK